jgi:hypothetical protein
MNLNDLHRRLLQDVLEIGNDLPLVITGGYAVQAHRIVDRFSRDIDMATDSVVAMEAIVTTVVEGLTGRGWRVEVIGVDPWSDDINRRLYAENYVDDEDEEIP